MEAFESYLQSIEKEKLTQFTKNFLEEWLYIDRPDKQSLKECLEVLAYEVNNILAIINPMLEDYKVFMDIKKLIQG
jgi:hypothetical protein